MACNYWDNIPNKFRILKERYIQMRKPYQSPGWTKNSSYYNSAPVGNQTHDLPPIYTTVNNTASQNTITYEYDKNSCRMQRKQCCLSVLFKYFINLNSKACIGCQCSSNMAHYRNGGSVRTRLPYPNGSGHSCIHIRGKRRRSEVKSSYCCTLPVSLVSQISSWTAGQSSPQL